MLYYTLKSLDCFIRKSLKIKNNRLKIKTDGLLKTGLIKLDFVNNENCYTSGTPNSTDKSNL